MYTELSRNNFSEIYFRNVFEKYIQEISVQVCSIGIANIPIVAFSWGKSKRKFVGGNPFTNKVFVHMQIPKFFEV